MSWRLMKMTDGKCAYCGVEFSDATPLTVDHFVPRKHGGARLQNNKFPCCRSCNSRKGTRPLENLRGILARAEIGQPRFTLEQLQYLNSIGVTLPDPPAYQFHWEKMGNTFPEIEYE